MPRIDAVLAPELLIADAPISGTPAPSGPCRDLCCRFWLFRLLFARWCRGEDAYEAYLNGLTSELETVLVHWDRQHAVNAR